MFAVREEDLLRILDEETSSIDQNDCESGSHYYPDNLFTKLKEKLPYHRPTDYRKLWVFRSPRDHSSCLPPSNSVGIQDKIKSALQLFDSCYLAYPLLIQFWAPVTTGGRCFLVTSEQPFGLYRNDERLCLYRNHSVDNKFVVDGKSEELLGFPARVFRQKWPESTPFGQCCSTKQHPWCNPSLNFSNLKLLALPVFEPSGECCAGVLEFVAPVLFPRVIKELYTALEKVDLKSLRSSYCFEEEKVGWEYRVVNQISNEGLQQALDEIKEVFKVVCNTYQLPLAQTWVPCKHCNAVACSSFPNKSPSVVLSKFVNACYARNNNIEAKMFLHHTCAFHLQKDQGVVGMAYSSHNSSFHSDITQFSSTEYPMVHYAREYQFSGCFAICLKSSYTGEDYYILEFFLPAEKIIYGHPRPQILDSILETLKQNLRSFKLASGEPLGVESVNFSMAEKHDFVPRSPPRSEALQNGGDTVLVNSSDQPLMVQDNAINNVRSIGSAEKSNTDGTYSGEKGTRNTSKREHEITREVLEQHYGRTIEDVPRSPPRSEALQNGGDTVLVNSSDQPLLVQDNAINNVRSIGSAEKSNTDGIYSGEKDTRKTSKREHEITREVLEQHYGRTIEDVAKTFNVSRSTFKRICREHKISRWPRCKNNSLSMQDSGCFDLQRVTAIRNKSIIPK
ncbi:hypothetical protein F0562_025883 [Nyssa sinensis]|uniref:RWP-RK domain-containing protein n=1 Tax=Nyssa sinensis TaxID=561372 RepID=A0A5J5BDA1_9ASTE|nr:hypothetical protein F0562_025883 [Nyssa sinensis]